MALRDELAVIPGTGYAYIAPVGTPKPTSLTDPDSPWENLGHSSLDDGLTLSRDGGDSNILGTWQNPALRNRLDPISYALVINLIQWDNNTFQLYFGGGDISVAGVFGVPLNPVSVEKALFVRIVDGANEFPFYVPKVSLSSDDDMEIDPENFMQWPVRATILGVTGSNLMEFYGSHLGLGVNEVQTVTITGTPTGGSFTLTFAGQTTGAIAWNATAAAVKTALVALSNITAGDVDVTGGPGPGTPWVVTFKGQYADTNIAQMTATGSFTGGTSPAVAVTTTTPGDN
ncbi:MAG TPA: hypothetical protein VIQ30_24250 [Pseudonocardia sp.]